MPAMKSEDWIPRQKALIGAEAKAPWASVRGRPVLFPTVFRRRLEMLAQELVRG